MIRFFKLILGSFLSLWVFYRSISKVLFASGVQIAQGVVYLKMESCYCLVESLTKLEKKSDCKSIAFIKKEEHEIYQDCVFITNAAELVIHSLNIAAVLCNI